MAASTLDIKQAFDDPEGTFGRPEQVLSDPRLDRQIKREILARWAQMERPGTGGRHDNRMLRRVLRTLKELNSSDADWRQGYGRHGHRRDAAPAGLHSGHNRAPKVADAMRRVEEVVHVDQDLHEAYVRMHEFRLPTLAVADGDEVVGVLAARDVLAVPTEDTDSTALARVGDHMSSKIPFCFEDDDLPTALTVMEENGQSRLLVTDQHRQFTGIVTRQAILKVIGRQCVDRPTNRRQRTEMRFAAPAVRARGARPGELKVYRSKPTIKD